jgi:hypothetical protein
MTRVRLDRATANSAQLAGRARGGAVLRRAVFRRERRVRAALCAGGQGIRGWAGAGVLAWVRTFSPGNRPRPDDHRRRLASRSPLERPLELQLSLSDGCLRSSVMVHSLHRLARPPRTLTQPPRSLGHVHGPLAEAARPVPWLDLQDDRNGAIADHRDGHVRAEHSHLDRHAEIAERLAELFVERLRLVTGRGS